MESARLAFVFKGCTFFLVIGILAFMLLVKQEFNSRTSTSVGILLTIYGLLMASIWDVNYVVIGMGLISVSGIVLIFQTGIGKLVYLLALLWLSIFASLEFGVGSSEVLHRVAFLYIVGAGLLFFVKDNTPELGYHQDEYSSRFSEKTLLANARLTERMENTNFDEKINSIRKIWQIAVVIGFIFAMIFIIFRVKSAYF